MLSGLHSVLPPVPAAAFLLVRLEQARIARHGAGLRLDDGQQPSQHLAVRTGFRRRRCHIRLYLADRFGLRVETRFQRIGGELLAEPGAVEHGTARRGR